MQNLRQHLGTQSDDYVADWVSNISPGSNNEMTARAEFLRRQTTLQREATQAAKEAAQAAKDTAIYTKKNARYMLWSVVVLAIASAISAGVAIHADNRTNNEIKRMTVPPCKDGSQTCKPWERDWGTTQLQPGSTVTDQETIVPPPTKP
jgi:hypothetical protein